jgi:hypothetical protein
MEGSISSTAAFGWDLQERLQALLRVEHAGQLPVAQAVIVETLASDILVAYQRPYDAGPDGCEIAGLCRSGWSKAMIRWWRGQKLQPGW